MHAGATGAIATGDILSQLSRYGTKIIGIVSKKLRRKII